jgi:hypothetical protein
MKHYFQTHTVVMARPLTAEDRAANGIEKNDPRKDHVGIFHPVTGQLTNTMDREMFDMHYMDPDGFQKASPLDLSDTPAIQPGTPQAPAADVVGDSNGGKAPAASNDPNDKPAAPAAPQA